MAKIGTIKAEIKADTGVIREALSKLDITIKQQLALQAALRDIDLDSVIESMDDAIWDQLKPLYEKNLEALNTITKMDKVTKMDKESLDELASAGKRAHTTIMDEYAGNEAWEHDGGTLRDSMRKHRCTSCGVILVGNEAQCPECAGQEL